MGAGNKTVQMAIVQYLNSIRQNLGPEAQRKVDHDGILIVTDDASMAEDLAPIEGQKPISRSGHDAELATERLMRGLPFTPGPQMIAEEYVLTWLRDMGLIVKQIQAIDGVGTQEEIAGLQNMAKHVAVFLQIMGKSDEEGPKVRQYGDLLGKLMNVVKGFAQRLAEQSQAGNGNGGVDGETQQKLAGKMLLDQAKAANTRESHAAKTAQRQAQFELEQQRLDRKTEADIRRENALAATAIQRDNAVAAAETAAEIRRQGAESMAAENEPTAE